MLAQRRVQSAYRPRIKQQFYELAKREEAASCSSIRKRAERERGAGVQAAIGHPLPPGTLIALFASDPRLDPLCIALSTALLARADIDRDPDAIVYEPELVLPALESAPCSITGIVCVLAQLANDLSERLVRAALTRVIPKRDPARTTARVIRVRVGVAGGR